MNAIKNKKFLEWMTVKEKLHNTDAKPPLVKERDLWWISFGENIGSEMNGKSKLFSRLGIVIRKLSRGFYLVAPTTSQKKEEDFKKIKEAFNKLYK